MNTLKATNSDLLRENDALRWRVAELEAQAGFGAGAVNPSVAGAGAAANAALLRDIYRTIPHGIQLNDTAGVITYANLALHALFGYEPGALIGMHIWDLPADNAGREALKSYLGLLLKEHPPPEPFRTLSRSRDGREVEVQVDWSCRLDEAGAVVGFISVVTDITDRRRAEEEMRSGRRLLRAIFDTIPEQVFVKDRQNRYVMVNRAWGELFGIDPERCGEYTADDLPVEQTNLSAAVRDTDREVLQHGRTQIIPRLEIKTKDGRKEIRRVFKAPLTGEDGKIQGIVGFSQNITAAVRAEAEILRLNEGLEKRIEERTAQLREAQAELIRTEKPATLGQLTATVSHELRNPLGTIRISVSGLLEQLGSQDAASARALARIERNVIRCDDIIGDLLDFSRTREANPVAVLIDPWLRGLIAEQDRPAWLQVELDLAGGDQPILLDAGQFRRAVINLVENAIKAMEGAQLSGKAPAGRLMIGSRNNGARLTVTVADTGPGMTPGVLARIFEPLYSTKTYGIGLGLPTVKQVMEQEGGGVEILSQHGVGTRANLWLPLAGHVQGGG